MAIEQQFVAEEISAQGCINEKGSSGTGDKSNRSEDEVFVNVAAEFTDISGFSPGVEECLVDADKSVTNTERIANQDSTSSQSVNDTAIIKISIRLQACFLRGSELAVV